MTRATSSANYSVSGRTLSTISRASHAKVCSSWSTSSRSDAHALNQGETGSTLSARREARLSLTTTPVSATSLNVCWISINNISTRSDHVIGIDNGVGTGFAGKTSSSVITSSAISNRAGLASVGDWSRFVASTASSRNELGIDGGMNLACSSTRQRAAGNASLTRSQGVSYGGRSGRNTNRVIRSLVA